MKLPLSSIIVGERQRIELGNLSDLDTMADPLVGQICPIVVHRTLQGFELVDGRRRLAKASALGWTEVECYEKDQLTPEQKQLAEFFADVARKDRTWQEQAITMRKLVYLMQKVHPEKRRKTLAALFETSDWSIYVSNIVAEALLLEPKDEAIWGEDSLINAYKLLLNRSNKETQDEMERRRLNAAQLLVPTQPLPSLEYEETPLAAPSDARLSSETSNGAIQIKLHGVRTLEGLGYFPAVVGFNHSTSKLSAALSLLEETGFALYFGSEWAIEQAGLFYEPLYWNRVEEMQTPWPFYVNVVNGFILSPRLPKGDFDSPASGVLSCLPFDEYLPREIISMFVNRVTTEGQSVLCVGDINPVHIAEAGRIPVFFEPDEEKFKAKCAVLKEFYLETFPNCEVTL